MDESPERPPILLLDDGELDRVGRMLEHLGKAFLRLEGRAIGAAVTGPTELLITSSRRAFQMPRIELPGSAPAPIWVCYHGQDFLPLRDQLRQFGVHYLVSSAVDQDTLRLFLIQLLRREHERRRSGRLPMGVRVRCRVGSQLEEGRLQDLSPGACRIVLDRRLAPPTPVRVVLPASLGGGAELSVRGSVRRVLPAHADQPRWSTLVVFDTLGPADRGRLEAILAGREIGTRVSPLAQPPPVAPPRVAAEPAREPEPAAQPAREADPAQAGGPAVGEQERRRETRRQYRRKVEFLELSSDDSEGLALGFDLSLTGVRVAGCPPLEIGMKLTLALYAGRREEPAVVSASVVRRVAEGDYALRFEDVSAGQRKELSRLAVGLGPLQALGPAARPGGPLVVARLLDAG